MATSGEEKKIVEFSLAREMPTLDGSTDPADFDHFYGIDNGLPPNLYPAIEYPTRTPMTFSGATVTVLISKFAFPVTPVVFKTRALPEPIDIIEDWSVTVFDRTYLGPPPLQEDYTLTGDLGDWDLYLAFAGI